MFMFISCILYEYKRIFLFICVFLSLIQVNLFHSLVSSFIRSFITYLFLLPNIARTGTYFMSTYFRTFFCIPLFRTWTKVLLSIRFIKSYSLSVEVPMYSFSVELSSYFIHSSFLSLFYSFIFFILLFCLNRL